MDVQLNAFCLECISAYEKQMDNEFESADIYFEDQELNQKHESVRDRVIERVSIILFFKPQFGEKVFDLI